MAATELTPVASKPNLNCLPDEIILRILSFLSPHDFPSLQQADRNLRKISLDNSHWRLRTFEESPFRESVERRHQLAQLADDDILDEPLLSAAASLSDDNAALTTAIASSSPAETSADREARHSKEIANWDPTFPGETTNWYREYIQRYATSTTSWLQQPRMRDGNVEDYYDVQGLALYDPPGEPGSRLAVSPLDDGSICLWDVKGRRARKGAMVAKSKPGILYIDGPGAVGRSRKIDAGVTECIAVDSPGRRAFVAVQGHLLHIDLETLTVVSDQSFEWSIAALSSASPDVPLTVGTNLGIHLYDHRAKVRPPQSGITQLFDPGPLPHYAPLSQPHPLSILHLPVAGQQDSISNDIYVAGRFSNILHYDRRKLQPILGTIYSGARLASLAALPYPFSPLDSEVRRRGELSVDQVRESKAKEGRTLIACGEYNSKGSLEMYALPAAGRHHGGREHNSNCKNRYNAAQSKILSVTNHGTRIVFSDGTGYIKWFERDGFTEVRRHRIGHSEDITKPSIFSHMPGVDDLARKILSTGSSVGDYEINDDDIIFWTGEKLGLVTFSAKPGFRASDFEEQKPKSEEERQFNRQEEEYSDRMRTALSRQADDARILRYLGHI